MYPSCSVPRCPFVVLLARPLFSVFLPLHVCFILSQRYKQRIEERAYERNKAAAAAKAAQETAREKEEMQRMFVEERRSWDANELNVRNHSRMIEKVDAALRILPLDYRSRLAT